MYTANGAGERRSVALMAPPVVDQMVYDDDTFNPCCCWNLKEGAVTVAIWSLVSGGRACL